MAKIDRKFFIYEPPEDTQARFVSDISPELRRIGGFTLDTEKPGQLFFSDRPGEIAAADGMDLSLVNYLFPYRIRVKFVRAGDGTEITVHGRTRRKVRTAVYDLLEHWRF